MIKPFGPLILALTVALAVVTSVMAADLPGSKDNPYVKRFDGSTIVRYKADNYDTLNFIDKDPNAPVVKEGRMVRLLYRIPAGAASSIEVFRNYEDELKSKNYTLVRSANTSDFPGSACFHMMNYVNQGGITPTINEGLQNTYYIYGVKHDPLGDINLSVSVSETTQDQNNGDLNISKTGDILVAVDSIQEKAVTNKMVDGTADDMAKQLASGGSVNLYGIYFDTDKTDVKPESKPTLDEVGKLLAGDAAIKLKVVGHTDNVGTVEHNNDLSLRRAQSVVQSLVTTYSVDAARLTPSGAGSTQPVASNDTEDGRAKNRRVELVKL
jgi:outer membrane protein OmpA-like peptidoglycan-associated protein